MEVETIKIKHKDGGFAIINKEDFDKKIHEEYKEEPKKEVKKKK